MPKRLKRLTDQEFYLMMAHAEPFEMVIKSAIVIESEIEEIFDRAFEAPKYLLSIALTYEQKLYLFLALGLDDRFKAPLTALAGIRNKFAHNLDVTFGKSEAKSFYSCFDKIDKKVIRETYERMSQDRGVPFAELPPKDLFALSVVTVRAAILAAGKQVDKLLPSNAPGGLARG